MLSQKFHLSTMFVMVAAIQTQANAQTNPSSRAESPPKASNVAPVNSSARLQQLGNQSRRLSQILNANVVLENGDAAGTINDFVVGPNGNLEYAIAADGDQFYSIPYGAVNLNDQNQIQLPLSAYDYQSLPFFSTNNWPTFNTPAYRQQMSNIFGTNAALANDPRNPNSPVGNSARDGFGNNALPNNTAGQNATGTTANRNATDTGTERRPYGNDALPSGNSSQDRRTTAQDRSNNQNNTPAANRGSGSNAQQNSRTGTNERTPGQRVPGSITGSYQSADQRNATKNNNAGTMNNNTGAAARTGTVAPNGGVLPPTGANRGLNNNPVPPNSNQPNPPRATGAATGGPQLGGPGSNATGTGAATGGPAVGNPNGPATGGTQPGNPNGPATGGGPLGTGTGAGAGGPATGGASGAGAGGAAPK